MNLAGEATITYEIADEGGVYTLGTRRVYLCGYSDAGKSYSAYWPHLALFCEICGTLWCRARNDYHFDYQSRFAAEWHAVSRPCLRCGGGLLLGNDSLEGADAGVLRWELNALLNQYEKEIA